MVASYQFNVFMMQQQRQGDDTPQIKDYEVDTVTKVEGEINLEISDADLVTRIKRRESQYKKQYNELKEIAKQNRNYWKGTQKTEEDINDGESLINVNRIFQSIETIIPIVTRKTPEPNVAVYPGTKNNLRLQEKLERKLKEEWEVEQDMQSKMEAGLRNLFTTRYMALKYYYDEDLEDMGFQLMPMNKLLFPYQFATADECPFIIEYVDSTLGKIEELFPDKYEELLQKVTSKTGNDYSDDTSITYIEYWENEFYICYFDGLILHKEENPNWNYENEELNHYKTKKKPYLFLNHLTFGDSMIDDTSLIEQNKTLQDAINKRKRQIELNAGMANGRMVIAGNRVPKNVADDMSTDPEEKIYLEGADTAAGAIDILQGRGVGQEAFNDMAHSEQQMDNIMGTHSTTRGERESQETALGRTILKDSDTGRLEILTRRIEKFAQEVYNAMIQMMYVFYTEQHPVHYTDETNSLRILTAKEKEDYIINTEFKDCVVKILVQRGSTVPRDKTTEKAEAVELFRAQAMSTVDMYRILEYPNAERLAKNAFLQQSNPEALYSTPDEGFDIVALDHISKIIDGEQPKLFESQNPDDFAKHLLTHQEYLKGTEVDSDLADFSDLSSEVKAALIDHIRAELEMAEALQETSPVVEEPTEELPPPVQEQPLPVEQMLPAVAEPTLPETAPML